MPLPTTKDQLLLELQNAYAKLDAEFDDVAPAQERQADLEGQLSCCDLVAYQLGWGRLLLDWDQSEQAGQTPTMPAPGFQWNQLGELAKSLYAQHAHKQLSELRQEFSALLSELTTWIQSIPEPELFTPQSRRWTGPKWPLAKWIQVNTIAPYKSARSKVRKWKRE